MAAVNHAASPRLTFSRGFSLAELAVVLLIVALLIAGMMIPLSAQQDIRARQETERILADIREALLGFAAGHAAGDGKPYLPCPDTDDDGVENRAASPGACTNQEGRIPWTDLGLARNDAWSNRYRYAVTAAFSNSATGFTLSSTGALTVCADSACAATIATNIPAIVLSHGPNGAGAFNMNGGTNPAPTDANELANTDGANPFVSRVPDTGFDDLVTWIPPTVLVNRLITAGKLP